MKKHYQLGTYLPTCGLVLLRFTAFIFLGLCVQTISAQSKCRIDGDGILLCDLSVSLIEEMPTTDREVTLEVAWEPTPTQRGNIERQLRDFSETWCRTTLGKSRIRNISVLRGYKKSSSDVALYHRAGRSYAYVGAFTGMNPSIVMYYDSYFGNDEVDRYLGRALAHEFSHAVLKIYDEYREFGRTSSDNCIDPIQSDNPRQTIMSDHRRPNTRYSHPDDYLGIPTPATAQHRCYGKSAWEVLLQPERCDSNLSLEVNAWFPRQDYFAEIATCEPSVPSINTLSHPDVEPAVSECVAMTRAESNIRFLSGSENIVIVIDSAIDDTNKQTIAGIVDDTIRLLARRVDIEDILNQNLVSDQDAVEKRLALLDFNAGGTLSFMEVRANNRVLRRQLASILANNPRTRGSIDQSLSSVRATIEGQSSYMNDYNVVIVISDTPTSASASALTFFRDENIPIHTIGISEDFNLGLYELAISTGGDYYTITPKQPAAAARQAVARSAAAGDAGSVSSVNKTITLNGNSARELVSVPDGSSVAVFVVAGDNGSILNSVTAIPSEGRSVNAEIIESAIGGISVSNPVSGPWEVMITGTGTFNFSFLTHPPLSLDINSGNQVAPRTILTPAPMCSDLVPDNLRFIACPNPNTSCSDSVPDELKPILCPDPLPQTSDSAPMCPNGSIPNPESPSQCLSLNIPQLSLSVYPAPVMVRARVHGRLPVLSANVEAEITAPNNSSMTITLLDDGKAPDFRSGDGIYTGVLKDYSRYGSGIYTMKVTASNPDGEAIFDDTGVATFGGAALEPPSSAPPFEVVGYHLMQIIVPAPNPSGENPARGITTDGTLHWGVIENPGDINLHHFVVDRTGTHYIQTSNLLGYDEDITMATHVRLYRWASNPSDRRYLAENVAYRETNVSHIEYMLEEGETYSVEVGHANDSGRGVYGLTVSAGNDLLSAHELSSATNSGGGSGGGGIAGALFLILLIIAFVVPYNRRKDRQNAC